MQLKRLTNDKPLWEAFLSEVDDRIAFCHKQMEQRTETQELFKLQGEIKALRNLKMLRDKLNG
jgi:hypothetical protein